MACHLPPGWEQRTDQSTGHVYYVDHQTRTTQWNHPDPWERKVHPESGRYYYANHETKQTQWDRPGTPNIRVGLLEKDENGDRSRTTQWNQPDPWERKVHPESGRYFYVNHETRQTQWDRPDTPNLRMGQLKEEARACSQDFGSFVDSFNKTSMWKCNSCGYEENLAENSKCILCESPINGSGTSSGASGIANNQTETESSTSAVTAWNCPACTLKNFWPTCEACGCDRPSEFSDEPASCLTEPDLPAADFLPLLFTELANETKVQVTRPVAMERQAPADRISSNILPDLDPFLICLPPQPGLRYGEASQQQRAEGVPFFQSDCATRRANQLGVGQDKDAYAGWYNGMDVAILHYRSQTAMLNCELDAHASLGMRTHIIRSYGIARFEEEICLIVELAEHGSLDNVFDSYRREIMQLEPDQLFEIQHAILTQVCRGMEAMASSKITHRNLAARNVMVSKFDISSGSAGVCVKVSDFGLSCPGGVYYSQDKGIPTRWCAPESLLQGRFSEASDVWAFCVFAWEVLSLGETMPYCEYDDRQIIKEVASGTMRLQAPRHAESTLWALIDQAMCHDMHARPTFADLHRQLVAMRPHLGTAVPPAPSTPLAVPMREGGGSTMIGHCNRYDQLRQGNSGQVNSRARSETGDIRHLADWRSARLVGGDNAESSDPAATDSCGVCLIQ